MDDLAQNASPDGIPGRFTTPVGPELLRGALEVERTDHGVLPYRLPAWARRQAPAELTEVVAQPAGVRLAFRTRATTVELDVLATTTVYRGAPQPPDAVYELLVDGRPAGRAVAGGGNVRTVDVATWAEVLTPGPPGTVRFTGLPDTAKDIEIWLPYRGIHELGALRTDAPVEPAPDPGRRVWLHHGSSISHGSNADGPTGTWPALAAARAGVELVNLGFSGNALLDPFTARTMRDTPADLISLKIGINLVNHDVMRLRAFTAAVHGFLDTLREGHPTTPVLVVSPLHCPIHEDTPGPAAPDLGDGRLRFRALGDPAEAAHGRLTLRVVRDELARITAARAADDPHLHHLDGRALYGEADFAEFPLPDDLHPDADGHRRIGENFAAHAFGSAWAR
ncbi:GDSL-type esterase/lipase family protein [Streptomyces erythrochromogenes]|uniref:GDSL-type esterase/lipase family protein n=1 Tax=Streptomyces erythrochromogenes TaxID=285574 RepID=UPI003865FFB5|nr:GDSL-type esterase/lipase family protein [Streptomyces erythrochromogenes]